MRRHKAASEPAFGSDSFLDVTANLVGVLIILIVLVGVRVAQAPPRTAAVDLEVEQRLERLSRAIGDLRQAREELDSELEGSDRVLAAARSELESLDAEFTAIVRDGQRVRDALADARQDFDADGRMFTDLEGRVAALRRTADDTPAEPARALPLVHQSPISRPVNSSEVHLELYSGRVSYVDLEGLIQLVRARVEGGRSSRGASAGESGEVGPIGSFRLRYSLVTLSSLTRSLYGGRYLKWRIVPVGERGESIDTAVADDSKLAGLLQRYSPNKYAVTVWTYPDSFGAFRQLRDHLSDRGYAVAARLLQFGDPISGSPDGVQSYAQ